MGGFSFQDSASLMIEELRDHGRAFALPETVVLFGYSWQQADVLRTLLRDETGRG